MKVKQKIIETRAGFRCRVCTAGLGRRRPLSSTSRTTAHWIYDR